MIFIVIISTCAYFDGFIHYNSCEFSTYIIIFIRTFVLSELCLESLDFMPFSSQKVQIIFGGILLYFYTSAIPQIQKVRIIRHFNPYSFFSVTSSETVKRELSALMPEYIVF